MTECSYTLAELQAMSTEELERAFPQRRGVWRARGDKVNIKALIRTIILAAKQLKWSFSEDRGVREFWYNPVKPILLKAEPGRDTKNYTRTTENVLATMVKEGLLSYADLGINDFRTMKQTYNQLMSNADCWKNILLFVEKDSAYVHLKPLQDLFNINILSGGGWSHAAGVERMLRELAQRGINEVVVFSLTDYDPFGYAIEREFLHTCEQLGLSVAEHHRAGIFREQGTPEILESQKYPITRGRALTVDGVSFNSNDWLDQYGIDRKYGLEIEAISGQPNGHQYLREIVAVELLKYLKESDRVEEITKEPWQNAPMKAVTDFIFNIDNTMIEPYEISELPEELPTAFIDYSVYVDQWQPLNAAMEEATSDVDSEIASLEDSLQNARAEKEDLEQPHRAKINELSQQYLRSRRLLAHCLWNYYNENQQKWPREKYDLGFPQGCIVEAVRQNKCVSSFKEQLSTYQIEKELQDHFAEICKNGEIAKRIDGFLNGGKP